MHRFGIQAPEVIADQVLGNPAHPGAEGGLAAEAVPVTPGLQVRQLQNIVCIFRVQHAFMDETAEFLVVVFRQVLDGAVRVRCKVN
jgi:hypothetical protein